MKSLLLAAVLAVPAAAFADGPPCRVPLSGRSETVPALSRTAPGLSELEVQKQCLKWEYNVPQKAEFIPPSGGPPRIIRTEIKVPPTVEPQDPALAWLRPSRSRPFAWPATYGGLFERPALGF